MEDQRVAKFGVLTVHILGSKKVHTINVHDVNIEAYIALGIT